MFCSGWFYFSFTFACLSVCFLCHLAFVWHVTSGGARCNWRQFGGLVLPPINYQMSRCCPVATSNFPPAKSTFGVVGNHTQVWFDWAHNWNILKLLWVGKSCYNSPGKLTTKGRHKTGRAGLMTSTKLIVFMTKKSFAKQPLLLLLLLMLLLLLLLLLLMVLLLLLLLALLHSGAAAGSGQIVSCKCGWRHHQQPLMPTIT